MEYISPNIFDSGPGKELLINVIYMPKMIGSALSLGFLIIPLNEGDKTAHDYVETMVYGGSITATKFCPETVFNTETQELEFHINTVEIEITSDGALIEEYKKKIEKLNNKLTNLNDSLISIAMSISFSAAAVAIPFSTAAGAAGIKSTIGQLKGLKNTTGEINEILDDCSLSADTLNSLIPGVGSTITGIIDLVDGTVTALSAIPIP